MAIDSSQVTASCGKRSRTTPQNLIYAKQGTSFRSATALPAFTDWKMRCTGSWSASHSVHGMVLNLENENVGCILLATRPDQGGRRRSRTGRVMPVPVGEELLGRVVNPLGEPIDGKGEIKTEDAGPSK